MSDFVSYEVQGPIGVITLKNPPVNALSVNKRVPQGILDAIKEGEHDQHVSGFLLIGAGRNADDDTGVYIILCRDIVVSRQSGGAGA